MPKHLVRKHDSLVKEATAIVLVEVVPGKHPESGEFKLVRALKGSLNTKLPTTFRPPSNGDWMTTFTGHSEPSFWQDCAGRLGIKANCTPIPPAFEVGHQYLIFIGIQPDTKQFEEITVHNDKWLAFVEQSLSEHAK
jgi:hypothetical protein